MVLTFFCACISVVSSLLLLFLFFFFCTIYILSLSFLPACFERYPEKAVFIVFFSPFPFFFSLSSCSPLNFFILDCSSCGAYAGEHAVVRCCCLFFLLFFLGVLLCPPAVWQVVVVLLAGRVWAFIHSLRRVALHTLFFLFTYERFLF